MQRRSTPDQILASDHLTIELFWEIGLLWNRCGRQQLKLKSVSLTNDLRINAGLTQLDIAVLKWDPNILHRTKFGARSNNEGRQNLCVVCEVRNSCHRIQHIKRPPYFRISYVLVRGIHKSYSLIVRNNAMLNYFFKHPC